MRFKNFIIISVEGHFACPYVCAHLCACRFLRPEEDFESPELGLQTVVGIQILRTELGTSGRAVGAINFRAISPAPKMHFWE